MCGVTQNFQNMSVNASPAALSHANSNPDLYNIPVSPVPPIHHASSVPYHINTATDPYLGTVTPPPSMVNTPPPSHTPPVVTNPTKSQTPANGYINSVPNRKFSAPSNIAHSAIFNQHGTPTMLQSSHLVNNVETTQNKITPINAVTASFPAPSPVVVNNIYASNPVYNSAVSNNAPAVYNPVVPVTTRLPATYNHGQMSSLPPMPATDILNQNYMFPRSNSVPGLQRVSPTNAFVAPPPTAGFYTRRISSGKNSPKSSSPGHSRHSSPIPPLLANEKLADDNELLSDTLKRLSSCREKCLCHLSNKISENINNRILTFEQCWTSGKLSNPVKLKMAELSEGDYNCI